MALGDAYATAAEYQAVATSDAGTTNAINSDLQAVSRWLDRKLGRFFNSDANVVTRTYVAKAHRLTGGRPVDWAESENPWLYGGYSRFLEVDDIATLNGLEIKIDTNNDGVFSDETALAITDYEMHPLNAELGPEPKPYERVVIPTWSSSSGFAGGQRVQVNAVFGWANVPAAIKAATIELTATLRTGLDRADQSSSGVRRSSMQGGLSIEYGGATSTAAAQHKALIESLMREYGRKRRLLP